MLPWNDPDPEIRYRERLGAMVFLPGFAVALIVLLLVW